MSNRLNEAVICWVWCQEDEKAKMCPITSATRSESDSVGGNAGRDERLWEMGMSYVAIYPAILPSIYSSACPAVVIFTIKRRRTWILLSPRACVSPSPLGILSTNTRPLSPALCYWHSGFRPSEEGSVNRDLSWYPFVLALQKVAHFFSGNPVCLILRLKGCTLSHVPSYIQSVAVSERF